MRVGTMAMLNCTEADFWGRLALSSHVSIFTVTVEDSINDDEVV
jgi:hypothetical protein